MAKLHIRPDVVKGHINPEIQGHFFLKFRDIFQSILDAASMRVFM